LGALVGGLAVPREMSLTLAKKLKPVCVFFLPLFFASAGLKTTLHLGAKGASGFAIIGTCLSAGLIDSHGYSALAFIILANTIMAAWGIAFQQRLARGWFNQSYAMEI
jgi:Kef-type K+ transport system membrane component KefB